MEAALGALAGVHSWEKSAAARQDFNRRGRLPLPALVDAEAGGSGTSVSALVFSVSSVAVWDLGDFVPNQKQKEDLASMHGALEFISSPKNKEEREMGGEGNTGLPRGRVQAEC